MRIPEVGGSNPPPATKKIKVVPAEICEIHISYDGKWVRINADGKCVCRIHQIKKLIIEDERFAITEVWDTSKDPKVVSKDV